MAELIDELRDLDRRDTRRAWWFGLGMVGVLLMIIGFVWARDVAPPDDSAMLPVLTGGNGKENGLRKFIDEVRAMPDSGFDDLSMEARSREWGNTEELRTFLGKNEARIEAWKRLMMSDRSGWRWGLQDVEPLDMKIDMSYLLAVQETANVIRMKSLLLARDGKIGEGVDMALDLWRMGGGQRRAQGALIHWLVSLTIESIGLAALEDAVMAGDCDDPTLVRIQEALAQVEESPCKTLKFTYQVEYLMMKNSLEFMPDYLAENANLNWAKPVIRAGYKRNYTLSSYIYYHEPLVNSGGGDALAMMRKSKWRTKQLEAWRDRGWWKYVHPNGMGQWMVASVATFGRIDERAAMMETLPGLTQLMLAVRRYEVERGTMPDALDELVPEFINRLPIDPLNGKPFRWDAVSQRGYSVFLNEVDDGGSYTKSRRPDELDCGVFYPWGEEAVEQRKEQYGVKGEKQSE
ncbi:hypothetical protein FEM03_02885 [Phragmitibacter flavus]|uniref:DUF4034 domain-containing protein n=1 Tax=Phragmitibacter flavus TaxID=2576071 RepID=A0A5R8KJ09_9BACT|nr:hypothetical protein [Phragmitibacter flavus]TLD72316.1 hypothetical protein FEM03_02885 [Phragmitibacter flavus]